MNPEFPSLINQGDIFEMHLGNDCVVIEFCIDVQLESLGHLMDLLHDADYDEDTITFYEDEQHAWLNIGKHTRVTRRYYIRSIAPTIQSDELVSAQLVKQFLATCRRRDSFPSKAVDEDYRSELVLLESAVQTFNRKRRV